MRRFEYANPQTVVLLKEARTCKGCQHKFTMLGIEVCAKGMKPVKRCLKYKETE